MNTNKEADKRVVKNTLLLYARMGLMMIISFFTARITLEALGVSDYGINNVVGGLVAMFSLISNSLCSSTSRFMTFGLGAGDGARLNRIFDTSVNIHIILAVVVVIAIETIGVWFLNNKMVIPPDRLTAARWVLQCSTAGFAIGLFSVPYNAAIVAHEKMDIYAYFTVFDAAARLVIVFAIKYYGGDKLILLAIISLIPATIKQVYYIRYCKKHFAECRYRLSWDKGIFKDMFGFSVWNFIGCTAGLTKDQGVNIAINMFHGPAINAARGIAMQINGIIGQFSGNFMTAINPQITKEWAAGNLERMHKLVFNGTRFSYYLFLLLSLPVFFEVETILQIWLGQVPGHTVLFARLALILSLAEMVSHTLITALNAYGNLRKCQLISVTLLMNFPVSYMLLRAGYAPETTLIVAIVISQICMAERLMFLKRMVCLPVALYMKKVYANVVAVTALAAIAPTICHCYMSDGWARFFVVCSVAVMSGATAIYFVGCDKEERAMVIKYARKTIERFSRNKKR